MTLNAVLRWKHPDSTLDMNKRLQTLVPRAIFDGGQVTPGAGLSVVVSPFKAISYDGMLCYDDAVQTLAVVASQTNYILVRAKYVTGTTPTLQWEVKSQAQYNADPDKNYLIVFGTVTLGAVVVVTNADISTLDRDAVDPMQRSPFRGSLDNPLLLPSHPPVQNHDGDFYFVLNSGGGLPGQTFYFWESGTSTWETLATGSYNNETTSMYDVIHDGERNRIEQGSGVIAGTRPTTGSPHNAYASNIDVSIIETPTVDSQIGINTFSAIVNGHYVQPYARNIAMPPQPLGPGDRYDLIFLEVYREAITTPENWDFPRNPDGAPTYTISLVSDNVETLSWQAGTGGDNFDLNELQADDHGWLVTKYRFGTVEGVADTALYNNTTSAALAMNVDGNAFAATPGTGIDFRVWRAVSATSADGFSYAIPLFVVRRTAAEDPGMGMAIMEFRNFVRYVFPVYPVVDVSHAGRSALDTEVRKHWTYENIPPYDKASGFLDLDVDVGPTGAANTIKFGDDVVKLRIRGYEEICRKVTADLGTPPAGVGSYDRTLVYIKMSVTLYADHVNRPNVHISSQHRPWIPSSSVATVRGQGWKRGYVNFEVVVNAFNATNVLDEDDAMVAAGWTKGDMYSGSAGKEYVDGGVWSRTVTVTEDDRVHPFEYEWAIPVCLVHRRNSGAWNYSTNPNGTGATRPDGKTSATTVHPDDILDLRRLVDVDEARLQLMLEEDIDKLMRGQLRTRMANKWAGFGLGGVVAGTRILQSDLITKGGGGGYEIVHNDHRKIYSDAREFQPVAESFPLNAPYNVPGGLVTWDNATGVLTILAPSGAHLVRNLPSAYIVDATTTNTTYLDFMGQPCWTTQESLEAYPTPATLKWIDATSGTHPVEGDVFDSVSSTDPAFTIAARDALDRATSMQITTDLGHYVHADILCVSYWVHYDRSTTGAYAVNYGLAEIPDEVHAAIAGPATGTPEEINIGTLYTIVRKTVAGASTQITSANILASSGTSGTTVVIAGIGHIAYGGAEPTVSAIRLTATATERDTATITFTAPIAMDIDVVVYYYTDEVARWIEVGRGGKSVRAYYEWHEELLDFSAGGPPADYAFDLGRGTWHNAEHSGTFFNMPIMLTSATGVATDPWDQSLISISNAVGYLNSNMVSFDPSAYGSDDYFLVIVPKWTAPTNALADELLIHYTYTPYQGLSGEGAIADPVTAVPKLKDLLHGTIVANSDHYVSQSGACSIFGGVDTWSGMPARVPSVGSMGSDRFGVYNATQLVKETKATGAQDLHIAAGASQTLYAAAILRMPFPMHPNMLLGGIYHEGTFDFDIDPGREGASVGFFGYAPGYHNKFVVENANGVQYSQFVNGVSRLCLPGEPRQADYSHEVWACEYQTTDSDASGAVLKHTYAWVISNTADPFYAAIPLRQNRNHIIGLIATLAGMSQYAVAADYAVTCWNSFFPTVAPGIHSYLETPPPEFTSPVAFPGAPNPNIPVLLCYNPGTVLMYLSHAADSVDASVYLHTADFGNFGGTVKNTFVIQESPRTTYNAGLAYIANVSTDLIRIPMGSSSLFGEVFATNQYTQSYAVGNSSLRGRTIAYPASWDVPTITALENFYVPSTSIHANYGRGIYLGNDSVRTSMPVLVPGSGTTLALLTNAGVLFSSATQAPDLFPVGPGVSPFATSPKHYMPYDHGGPIGYCFYGLVINPSDDQHHGQAVMQISGGPFMGMGRVTGAAFSSDVVDGTALDAFWPSRRPILKTGQ